ncbi:hypothetical protein DRQ05_00435 [bacterium]|nr:MAG: hypothetical protein DRQ05_00435 [bacterium]
MENEEIDSLNQILQDFSSYILKLKKKKQYYSIVRLISRFMHVAQELNLDVTEFEYYLEKYSQEERTEKDMTPQEIDVLLSSYEDRLKESIRNNPQSTKKESVAESSLVEYSQTEKIMTGKPQNIKTKISAASSDEEHVFNQIVDDVLNENSEEKVIPVFPLKNLAINRPFSFSEGSSEVQKESEKEL